MEQFDDDDEDEYVVGEFEDGHWEWNDCSKQLVFISHVVEPEEQEVVQVMIDFGSLEFKEDIDLIEQQKFRKRFQGKPSENDVITLENIRDVALFTAPRVLMKPAVINILHTPTMERFLRALILYCQYYLQVTEELTTRIIDGLTKIRTVNSDKLEMEFQQNLEDLRLLLVKEYSVFIMGENEFTKYHHMGPAKTSRSMLKRDSNVFESVLRISIQIVWIALGRKLFNQIELEIHRIFKSQAFNIAEHKLKQRDSETSQERSVLKGQCLKLAKKICMQSPLMNELLCERDVDYRIYGLGVLNYQRLDSRLRYMELVLTTPENKIKDSPLSLGILGLPRANFDTLLRPISTKAVTSASTARSGDQLSKRSSVKSTHGSRKSNAGSIPPLYGPICLPATSSHVEMPLPEFTTEYLPQKTINQRNRKLWLQRSSPKNGKRHENRKK